MKPIFKKMFENEKKEKISFWNTGDIIYKPKKYHFGGGSGGGGGGNTQTIQKTEPWDSQKPHLDWMYNIARDNFTYTNPPEYYSGNTVVPFSNETQTALQMQAQRAANGSPVQTAANNQLTNTLNGNYLFGNPGFDQAVNATMNRITPQITSAFNKAGRTGSGLATQAVAQAASDAYAGQYANERENQQRAMLFAPQMLQQDYVDAAKLAEVGAQREALDAENINDSINRYYANDPYYKAQQKLGDYMSFIQGNTGSSTVSNATGTLGAKSAGSGLLGGGLLGYGMASSMGFNPLLGAGLGAISGGLLNF